MTGPGGVGKTALALAVASMAPFPDGVFVVWLASLRSAEHIAGEVAAQVGLPRSGGQSYEDALVESVKKTNRCVVAHEAVVRGGFGAEVAAVIQYQAFDWLDAPIERVGAKFCPMPFAPVMEEWVVPHANDVLEAIRRTVGRNGD